ncbi:MAG TPA: YtxH domain-containing protein [Candidatus Baltobacteraceae bacterium]|nr:YtxH domain-containing protein [Candidatus Baltobacteraceae bacterium]
MNQGQDASGGSEKGGGGFFAGFMIGAIAGGVIAYLITQEEARDLLMGKAREASNYAMDATGDLRSKAADLYERGKNVVENARSNINAAVDEGQTSAESIRDDLSRQSSDS